VEQAASLIATGRAVDVVHAVVQWSEEFIEQAHEIFGGLPVCPFARGARLKQTIRFEVRDFDLDDPLDSDGEIITLVREFAQEAAAGRLETMFVIHPDRARPLAGLLAFVARLNVRMGAGELRDFQAFEAHPESDFRVGSLYTRRSPYPSFQVLSRALLKKGSDSLLESSYYSRFSAEMLQAVGMPRT
jgi:hypothetical protein